MGIRKSKKHAETQAQIEQLQADLARSQRRHALATAHIATRQRQDRQIKEAKARLEKQVRDEEARKKKRLADAKRLEQYRIGIVSVDNASEVAFSATAHERTVTITVPLNSAEGNVLASYVDAKCGKRLPEQRWDGPVFIHQPSLAERLRQLFDRHPFSFPQHFVAGGV